MANIGKVSVELLREVILPHLGAELRELAEGPGEGVDFGVVEVGDRALAITADPFFLVPEYGWDRAGWFAVHILLSDVATSGLRPKYLAVSLNLPPGTTDEDLRAMWLAVHRAAREAGVGIVTGHTARYEGCSWPMAGGAVAMAVGPADGWVAPRFIHPGDKLIITKGPAVEAAGILAVLFGRHMVGSLGEAVVREAQALFWKMSVVEDASLAAEILAPRRELRAMHDATEGGILRAAWEMAEASSLGLVLDLDAVPASEPVRRVCELFGMDPYSSISEGTLLLAVAPDVSHRILEAYEKRGIPAWETGEFAEGERVVRLGGRERPLEPPARDPFWEALSEGARRYHV